MKVVVKPFSINLFGEDPWEFISQNLHRLYQGKPFFLAWVCPVCKGLDFNPASGVYLHQGNCPTCDSTLVPFWSKERTQHYFSSSDFIGSVLFVDTQIAGWCFGFPYPKNVDTFYCDMVCVFPEFRDRSYWKDYLYGYLSQYCVRSKILYSLLSHTVPSCRGQVCFHIIQKAAEAGYKKLRARTLTGLYPVERLFRIFGFLPTSVCEEDSRRTIWIRYFSI